MHTQSIISNVDKSSVPESQAKSRQPFSPAGVTGDLPVLLILLLLRYLLLQLLLLLQEVADVALHLLLGPDLLVLFLSVFVLYAPHDVIHQALVLLELFLFHMQADVGINNEPGASQALLNCIQALLQRVGMLMRMLISYLEAHC